VSTENKKLAEDGKAGTPPAEADAPKYITADDLQDSLSARFKPLEQKFDKWLNDTFTSTVTKLRAELAPRPATPPTTGPSAPETKTEGKTKETSPELVRLQEQIASLTKQNEEARSERDAERAKAKDTRLRHRVSEALSGSGVEGVRVRHALGLLVDAEKRVRWSEDGETVLLRSHDGAELELAQGVKEWLATEDGKFYLPARGAAGSGDRPGASPPPRTPPGTPPDRATVAEGLRRALTGQIAG
jgi:hypothetical protein